MKMSIRMKAFLNTLGFAVVASIGALLFVFATMWIPFEFIVYALIFGMFAYGFWIMYQVNLERLEREESRKK